MSRSDSRAALAAALGDHRRNLSALAAVALAFLAAELVGGSPSVRYGAYLVAFAVWMAWFVLAAVDWIDRADF